MLNQVLYPPYFAHSIGKKNMDFLSMPRENDIHYVYVL